jgi:hypothetical protein
MTGLLPAGKTHSVYVAGPMQGIPEFNFLRFNAVAWALRLDSHKVFNPAERDIERHGGVNIAKGNMDGSLDKAKASHGFSLRSALADDTNFICLEADWVVLLPGWEKSNGAQAEHRLAVALQSEGMQIRYLSAEECTLLQVAHEQFLDSEAKAA